MAKLIHTLDPDIAVLVGVNAALIYEKIWRVTSHIDSEKATYFNGQYWYSCTYKSFTKEFGYLSEKQIRSALNSLVDKGFIFKKNINASKKDRTLSWAVNTNYGGGADE